MPPPSGPILVDDLPALQQMVKRLASEAYIAVDTESNSMHAYRERICLIQFSIPSADFLVDPLAINDLAGLRTLFADRKIEKILHGAEYDLLCLRRDYNFELRRLFDTRAASRTLGAPASGLGDLLSQYVGVTIDKRFQRADWGRRPLSPAQLDYARLDTHYLIELRHRLAKELQRADRYPELVELCEWMAAKILPNNGEPNSFWRVNRARSLTPREAAVLRELHSLRETHARRLDRPPFKVLGDRTLIAIAQAQPSSLEALADLPGMSQGQVRRYGAALLDAVRKGRQAPAAHPPRTPRVEPRILERYELLRTWRKRRASARQVDSDVILPREVVWEIARQGPRDQHALGKIMAPLKWRRKTYGAEILELLRQEGPKKKG
jgi:ribonuclease D